MKKRHFSHRSKSSEQTSHRAITQDGVLKIAPDGYGFVIAEAPGSVDVFVPERALRHAMHGDRVRVEISATRGGKSEGRVVQVLERASAVMIGTLKRSPDGWKVLSRDGGRTFAIDLIAAEQSRLYREGDVVAVKLIRYPSAGMAATGDVLRVLGADHDLPTLTQAVLLRRQILREFPVDVRQQCRELPDEVFWPCRDPHRLDLTALPIITIDGARARDFDDAVCAIKDGQDTLLTVCIADVAEYVQTGTALDQEAYRRATSTYLPRECIPMLPEKLSNDLCSLREGEPRFVLTAEMRFNGRGEPTRARFFKGIIRSRKRTTYEQVQNYFDARVAPELPTDVITSLSVMRELAEVLQVRSRARGAMALELPETESIFNETGVLAGFRRAGRLFAHKLIEEFMIAANVAVAALFARQGLPQLFRVHDSPDVAKLATFLELLRGAGLRLREEDIQSGTFLEQLRGHPLATYLQSVYLRSLKQAIYDPENRGHFGLALQDYCHFTSPIRRYPDLVVHRQLRCLLERSADGIVSMDERRRAPSRLSASQLPYSFADLTAIGRQTSRRERDSAETEREVIELEKVFFMQSRVGRQYQGTVTRIVRFGAFVELDGDFVEGLLQAANLSGGPYDFDQKRVLLKARRSRRALRIGDRVTVQVSRVDIELRRIELAIAGEAMWTGGAETQDERSDWPKSKHFHERKGKGQGKSGKKPLKLSRKSRRRKKRARLK